MREFGLVLAGGGTRGAAHVGVLMALEEKNLKPRSIAGTSAGSIVAGLYASGMSTTKMKEVVIYLTKRGYCLMDPDYLGILKLISELLLQGKLSLSGLLKGKKLKRFLCSLTDGMRIKDVPMEIVIPAVDLNSGNTIVVYINRKEQRQERKEIVWETEGMLCNARIASSSVPAVFRPRQDRGYCLVDGGVTDNLPVNLLKSAGEKTVIGVASSEDYEMPEKDTVIEIASHSLSIMSEHLKRCVSRGEKLLLQPDLPKEAGLLTFHQMEDCMNAGYECTKRNMPEIKRILAC